MTNFNIATEQYEEAKEANDTEKMAALQPALKVSTDHPHFIFVCINEN